MKFGLFHTVQWPDETAQRDRYREAIEEATYAEEVGFESVWFTEHHFSRHGIVSDSLNMLSHLAAETDHVRLGTAVAVLPFHNPLRLAESSAMVDILSDGRLDFGVGRGYQWSEFHGFSVSMSERAERFQESIDVITHAWTHDEPFTHNGKFWQFEDANPQPKPVQQPHPPIWVATDSEEGLRSCVEHDWGIMLPQGRPLSNVAEQMGRYKKILGDVNAPFNPSRVVLARGLYVGPTDEVAWEDAEGPYRRFQALVASLAAPPGGAPQAHNPFGNAPDISILRESCIFGSPDTCVAALRRLQDLGVDYVIFFIHFGGLAHEKILRSLQRFSEEVMPRLAAKGAVV